MITSEEVLSMELRLFGEVIEKACENKLINFNKTEQKVWDAYIACRELREHLERPEGKV